MSAPVESGRCDRLRLTPHLRERLRRLANTDGEQCGYLLGPVSTPDLATTIVPTRNVSISPWRFAISQADASRVERHAVDTGQDLRAVFHTHPRGLPTPSAADSRRAARSTLPWVIATQAGVAVVSV